MTSGSVPTRREDILRIVRAELPNSQRAARKFKSWFVEIDGEQLSCKWVVSVASRRPINAFQTAYAVRWLEGFGFSPTRIASVKER